MRKRMEKLAAKLNNENVEKNDGFVQTEHGCAKIMF